MDEFIIQGGYPLSGEVTPSGNKNAALPLLAATLLTEYPVILHNVPDILDVKSMRSLLISLGVQLEHIENHTWRIQASEVRPADLDPDLCGSFLGRNDNGKRNHRADYRWHRNSDSTIPSFT